MDDLKEEVEAEPLQYIAWALPSTLLPLIKARRQFLILPSLNFASPLLTDAADVCRTVHISKRKCNSEHADEKDCSEFSYDHLPRKGARYMTLAQLWHQYETAVSSLRKQIDDSSGVDAVFEWLDEAMHRPPLTQRVYQSLRFDIESNLRNHLDWAHKKIRNARYQTSPQDLKRHLLPVIFDGASIPDPPQTITKSAIPQDRAAADYIYGRMSVVFGAQTQKFPAVFNNLHSEKSKAVLWELARLLGGKRCHPLRSFPSASRSADYLMKKPMRKSTRAKKYGTKTKREMSRVRKSRAHSYSLRTSVLKRNFRGGAVVHDAADDGHVNKTPARSVSELDEPETMNMTKKRKLTGRSERRKLTGRSEKTPTMASNRNGTPQGYSTLSTIVSGMSSGSDVSESRLALEANKRPVAVKKGHHEYYTVEELTLLRKHAFNKYTIELYDDAVDLSADDPVIDDGPKLPAPHLMKLFADMTARKRWRLSDLFSYADKNKTWKLDMSKVQKLCEKMGMDKVTEATILDMMVEIDEATREAVTFKELRNGMRAWIKERRTRLRYCMEVEDLQTRSKPVESFASFTSGSGRRTKTGFIKDTLVPKKEPFNAIRQHVRKNNQQPIMPPDDIGTEVCDIPGQTCNWHAVFPERLILAWRIQQRLEKLYAQSRWLDIKKILRVFGYYRTADFALVDRVELEQAPAEPEILTSEEQMERLARQAPSSRRISTDAAVKRLSLRDDGSPFTPRYTPSKNNRLSENDAEIHLPNLYNFTLNDPMTPFGNSLSPFTPPPAMISLRFSPQETSRLQLQAKELRDLEKELAKYRSQSPGILDQRSAISPHDPQQLEPKQPFQPQQPHYIMNTNVPEADNDTRHLSKQANNVMHGVANSPHLYSEANIFDHGKPKKKPSIVPTSQGDRTDYEKFLRRRFREIHNVWLVDPTPTDVLEALQLRAVKMLQHSAKQGEERLLAAADPSRKNEPARDLVDTLTGVLKETRKELVSPSRPLEEKQVLPQAHVSENNEVKRGLLTENKGLFRKDYCFMDPRIRAIMAQSRRLKSELELEEDDCRRIRRITSNISCRSAPPAISHKSRSNFSVSSKRSSAIASQPSNHSDAYDPRSPSGRVPYSSPKIPDPTSRSNKLEHSLMPVLGSPTLEISPSVASSVRKEATPQTAEDNEPTNLIGSNTALPVRQRSVKMPKQRDLFPLLFVDSIEVSRQQAQAAAEALSRTPERRLGRMMSEVTFMLESFLSEKREHLMRGLTKQIKKQAREMQVSQFQSVETVERRLVQQARMKKIQECYEGSMRRGMWTDFRQLIKSVRKRDRKASLPEDNLRRALLRADDVDHEVERYDAAVRHFEELLRKACDGPAPNNTHRKWFKRFLSLPSFFPLSETLDLMKTMQAFETAEIA